MRTTVSCFDFAVVVLNVELSWRGCWLLMYYPKQWCAPWVIFLQPDLQNSDAKTWHTSICSMSSAQKKTKLTPRLWEQHQTENPQMKSFQNFNTILLMYIYKLYLQTSKVCRYSLKYPLFGGCHVHNHPYTGVNCNSSQLLLFFSRPNAQDYLPGRYTLLFCVLYAD